jgi:hypothetical protein
MGCCVLIFCYDNVTREYFLSVTVHGFLNLELKHFCNCLREKSIFLRPERATEF